MAQIVFLANAHIMVSRFPLAGLFALIHAFERTHGNLMYADPGLFLPVQELDLRRFHKNLEARLMNQIESRLTSCR